MTLGGRFLDQSEEYETHAGLFISLKYVSLKKGHLNITPFKQASQVLLSKKTQFQLNINITPIT